MGACRQVDAAAADGRGTDWCPGRRRPGFAGRGLAVLCPAGPGGPGARSQGKTHLRGAYQGPGPARSNRDGHPPQRPQGGQTGTGQGPGKDRGRARPRGLAGSPGRSGYLSAIRERPRRGPVPWHAGQWRPQDGAGPGRCGAAGRWPVLGGPGHPDARPGLFHQGKIRYHHEHIRLAAHARRDRGPALTASKARKSRENSTGPGPAGPRGPIGGAAGDMEPGHPPAAGSLPERTR